MMEGREKTEAEGGVCGENQSKNNERAGGQMGILAGELEKCGVSDSAVKSRILTLKKQIFIT